MKPHVILGFLLLVGAATVHAKQPAGIGGDVTVINEISDPVPVTITDPAPSSQRVRILLGESTNCANVPCGSSFSTSSYSVPENKILLIDEVAVSESFTGLAGIALISITGVGEQIQVPAIGPLVVAGGRSTVSRSTRMHTSGFVQVEVNFDAVPTGLLALRAVIFGRLVDGTDQVLDCDPDSCF